MWLYIDISSFTYKTHLSGKKEKGEKRERDASVEKEMHLLIYSVLSTVFVLDLMFQSVRISYLRPLVLTLLIP